ANPLVDHLDICHWHSHPLQKMGNGLRDSNSTSAGQMAEESISGTNNSIMGRVYDSANTRFPGSKTGMQVSGIEVAMDYVRPFLFDEVAQSLECILIKKVLIIVPWMDHLNTMYLDIEF